MIGIVESLQTPFLLFKITVKIYVQEENRHMIASYAFWTGSFST